MSWADAVDLRFCMSNHLLSTMKEAVEGSLRSQPSLYRLWSRSFIFSEAESDTGIILKRLPIGPKTR